MSLTVVCDSCGKTIPVKEFDAFRAVIYHMNRPMDRWDMSLADVTTHDFCRICAVEKFGEEAVDSFD